MGEIADMILDGILDEQTGEFIDDEISMNGGCGYPRSYNNNYKKQSINPTRKNNMRGIYKYLRKQGLKEKQLNQVINKYSLEILKGLNKNATIKDKSVMIQQDFGTFVNWFKLNK